MSAKKNKTTYIAQGEFSVSDAEGEVIATILGSCVSACIWDPAIKIGGMNHFLLPDNSAAGAATDSFGANAMELLINALVRKGANRSSLKAKAFGGAALRHGLTTVGSKNADFVVRYLENEGIPCVVSSLGGTKARRIEFEPATGNARQKFVVGDDISEKAKAPPPANNDLELF